SPMNSGSPTAPTSPAPNAPTGEFEMENYEYNNMEMEGEITDREGTFNEMTEMELASELLSLNHESEIEHFLGDLFKKAVGGISGILGGPQGDALKKLLGK